MGVVNGSINLTFTIERSSPPVAVEDIKWTFTSSSNGGEEEVISSNRSVFSSGYTSLVISNLQNEDEGVYTLTASNPAGVNYSTINLTIECKNNNNLWITLSLSLTPPAGPVFTERPVDSSRLQGENGIFNCSAISEPVYSIRWEIEGATIAQYISTEARDSTVDRFNRLIPNSNGTAAIKGVNITTNSSKYTIDGNETSSTYGQLMIYNTILNDATNYTCIITNVHGNISTSASLTVQG